MSAIEDAIAQAMTAIWESLLDTGIRRDDGAAAGDSRESTLVGCIHVAGPEGGVVTVECSEALASETAAAMFQLSQEQVSMADAQDALGELTNIMGGNFKALLSEGHQLSLPTVVEGRDFRTKFIGTTLEARVPLDCTGRRLVVCFFRDRVRAVPRPGEQAGSPDGVLRELQRTDRRADT